ncbi:hypothetical protein [Amnibacterium setariae]|uniref:hypothetical protein n=1 Tax=Amnibacterium setariae TaxID=2306585 RepID=UPI0022793681|nr:hypothetical protein [Amnibacterium setariae]
MRSWFWIASAMPYGVVAERVQRSAVDRITAGTSSGRLSDCASPGGSETEAARRSAALASTSAERTV